MDISICKLVEIFQSTPVFHVAAQRLHAGVDCSNGERRFHIWVRVSLQSLHNINDIGVSATKNCNEKWLQRSRMTQLPTKEEINCSEEGWISERATKTEGKQLKTGQIQTNQANPDKSS